MRVLVCGHREFDDWELLNEALRPTLEAWLFGTYEEFVIIEGEAKGADFLARVWAKYNGVPYEAYPADWNTYGAGAGPIRNKQMLTEGKPDLVVAFPGGKGTKNMVDLANEAKVSVVIINESIG